MDLGGKGGGGGFLEGVTAIVSLKLVKKKGERDKWRSAEINSKFCFLSKCVASRCALNRDRDSDIACISGLHDTSHPTVLR